VGDRPHDRDAADAAGVPFLGVGEAVPGDHPLLGISAEAEHLVEAVENLTITRRRKTRTATMAGMIFDLTVPGEMGGKEAIV